MSPRKQFVLAGAAVTVVSCLALGILYAILANRPLPIEVRPTAPRIMGLPPAPHCDPLYNTGRHAEWARCMGVGYDRKGESR